MLMSVGSEVDERKLASEISAGRSRMAFPCEAIPYLLSTADAMIVLLGSLFGGFFYHWVLGTPIPDLTAY